MTLASLPSEMMDRLRELLGEGERAGPAPIPRRRNGEDWVGDVVERARKYLQKVEPAVSGQGGHNRTFYAACKVGPGFNLGPETALELLRDWNSFNQPPWSDADLRHKNEEAYRVETRRGWLLDAGRNGHGARDGTSAAPRLAIEPDRPNEGEADPHRLARVVLGATEHLVSAFNNFHLWDGTRYVSDADFSELKAVPVIKADLDARNLEALARHAGRGRPPEVPKVTRRLIGDVELALRSMCAVDRRGSPPFWIGEAEGLPDPLSIVPCRNGLLDLSGPGPVLMPHTPDFFNLHAVPCDYDPAAPFPNKWWAFLCDQWADDPESIDCLHEQLGYLITPDNSLQKVFLWIGPPRSGRGTIREIMTALVGERNVGATSAAALGSDFGLQGLLEKSVVVMGDLRTGDTHDSAAMLDRMLTISGGDPVAVNRKNMPMLVEVLLRLRFIILSNEIPNIRDSSGAIVTRYLVLKTTRTIPPEERRGGLAREIVAGELSGILNLAIQGYYRLRARGRFLQPASGADLIETAEQLASPIKSFVDDTLIIGTDEEIACSDAWERWCEWAKARGFNPGNIATFGRNLKAAYPQIAKSRPWAETAQRPWIYKGIGPKLNKVTF